MLLRSGLILVTWCVIVYSFLSCGKDEINASVQPPFKLPVVKTSSPTEITESSATAGGTVDGGSDVNARGVVWDVKPLPTTTLSTKTSDGSGSGAFVSKIVELSPGTKYYLRAYAINGTLVAYGNEINFSTKAIIPLVNTADVSNISSHRATVSGNILSDGGSKILEKGFVWDVNHNPTIDLSTKISDRTTSANFSLTLPDLNRSTTYYVRAYAANSVGTSYGSEISLTTTNLPIVYNNFYPGLEDQWAEFGKTQDGGLIINSNGSVLKTDSLAVIEWQRPTENRRIDGTGGKIFQDAQGNYIICGYLGVQKLDNKGNLLWTYPRPIFYDGYNAAVQAQDGGYIVVGIRGPSNTGLYFKLDNGGKLLWEKTFNQSTSLTHCQDVIRSQGNTFLVVGGADPNFSTILGATKIDESGAVLWSKAYELDEKLNVAFRSRIRSTQNGGFVIGATVYGYFGARSARLVTIDQDGNKKWDKVIQVSGNTTLKSITTVSDGYIIAGSCSDAPTRACAIKVDLNGKQIWVRQYQSQDNLDFYWEFTDVVETPSASFTLLGFKSYIYGSAKKGMWLLRSEDNEDR